MREIADSVGAYLLVDMAHFAGLVAAGLYRYFRLVYQHEEGGRPEKVLLTDPPLILTMLAYGVITVTLFLLA